DVPETAPVLSILSPFKGDGPDICLAAGFFPQEKNMTLTLEDKPERPTPNKCETNAKTSASGFIDTGVPKMNFMNLLVTGLRILLAKCVAVNVMMTVKAFVF
ncbi:hypothetical protein cypCar_00002412, partial [Cyprinus carpio]